MKTRHHLLFFLLLLLSVVILFISDDIRTLILDTTGIDSFGHIISFFILSWLLSSILKLPLLNIGICLIFYGALSEIGQYYLGFRNGEFRDFVADLIGISLFMLLKWFAIVYGKKHSAPQYK